MYTEEQAKRKWCPMGAGNEELKCAASTCMAWRWSGEEINTGKTIRDQYEGTKPVYADGGYCGLAGKP